MQDGDSNKYANSLSETHQSIAPTHSWEKRNKGNNKNNGGYPNIRNRYASAISALYFPPEGRKWFEKKKVRKFATKIYKR